MIKPISSDGKPNQIPQGISREALSGAEQVNSSMRPIVEAYAEKRKTYLESKHTRRLKIDWRNGGGKADRATSTINKTARTFKIVTEHASLNPATVIHKSQNRSIRRTGG
jgi:hypothetical protein